MPTLVWDNIGEHFYEAGVQKGVLYTRTADGAYGNGVAWNGLISVSKNPSGAESTPFYANDSKYLNLTSAEEFGATIGAYTYPPEFNKCLGIKEIAPGVYIGQQDRETFGFCYRTSIGNDVDGIAHAYKLHLVYGCLAAPSEEESSTINDSPEPTEFSWEISTTPVVAEGFKPTSLIEIDSRTVTKEKLEALEAILYGGTEAAKLPLPNEIKTLFAA
jgi:hypothetical protein